MNRRHFFGTVAAVVVAPKLAVGASETPSPLKVTALGWTGIQIPESHADYWMHRIQEIYAKEFGRPVSEHEAMCWFACGRHRA